MKYLYIDNLAYPYALQSVYAAKGQWPEGKGVDIDEAIFREYFHDTPPEGKRRITAGDGMPAWADVPPPTREEQIASAETKKQQLINQANEYINSKQWPGKASIVPQRRSVFWRRPPRLPVPGRPLPHPGKNGRITAFFP